jgi:hypothetical protein
MQLAPQLRSLTVRVAQPEAVLHSQACNQVLAQLAGSSLQRDGTTPRQLERDPSHRLTLNLKLAIRSC